MAVSMIGFNRSIRSGFAVDGSGDRSSENGRRQTAAVLRMVGMFEKIGFSP
ncbi:MAG: hypothetical protein WAV08_08625 [Desulfobacterales bacterium]|jgi:hypothetical protein